MDDLLVLLGVVVLAIPVGLIVLAIAHIALRGRVQGLEKRLESLIAAAALPLVSVAATVPPTVMPAPVSTPEIKPEAGPVVESLVEPARVVAVEVPAEAAVGFAAEPLSGPAAIDQNRPIVLNAERASAFGVWVRRNWVYVVSAASLALAGVFLVQYGVQRGLLPPWVRVVAAMGFGGLLIGAGEWLRRRGGDGEGSATAYLPSVFAGAGLVTIFAATIAARQLYELISPTAALVLHVVTALLAVGLGWFYGPLLVGVGLLGAAAAPFLIGAGGGVTVLLYAYYGLITANGLAIDAVRRWAWVSVLALALGYGGSFLMLQSGAGEGGWQIFLLFMALAAIVLPLLRVIPEHPGPATFRALLDEGKSGWPTFPVRLAAGPALVSTVALLLMPGQTAAAGLAAFGALTLLALVLLLATEKAEGLADLALLPALAIPLRLSLEATQYWPLARDFAAQAIALRPPEAATPLVMTWLVAMATLVTAAFAWRALRGGPAWLIHSLGAVLVAPVSVAVAELLWQPASVLGLWGWALHAMLLAAVMVGLASRFAGLDGADHRRTAYATLSALALVALALFLLTTATALTLALAVLVVVAAALDKRFTLPEMGLFIQIAVVAIGYRLVVGPGIDWALRAPLFAVLLAFAGVVAAEVASLWVLRGLPRPMTCGVLESAALALIAVLFNILVARWLVGPNGDFSTATSYSATLHALPWLVMMLVQTYRANLGGPLQRLRQIIAVLAGLAATAGLLVATLLLNPLFAGYDGEPGALVIGPMILDSLALAYAMPGLILLLAARRLGLSRQLSLAQICVGAALLALYVGLEIRRFWQGDYLATSGVLQNELYSYTVALTLLGAGLLYQAIARRSALLRRIGMAVISVTIAKVFLIDAAGLSGLTRVFSFLGLGLSLAGLAWLNRWAEQVSQK